MCGKGSLAFILNTEQSAPQPQMTSSAPNSPHQPRGWLSAPMTCDPESRAVMKRLSSFNRLSISNLLAPEQEEQLGAQLPAKTPKRRKIVGCKMDGCKSRALTRGLCMRHGGGSRCRHPGCNNGAKLRNLCFQHGGSTTCLEPNCANAAKRFGYCWTHGGAYMCSHPSCQKFAAQGGLCWAHGGGNRCRIDGCSKRSYKQYDYRCKEHASELQL
ncbi:hypothetical protein Poli38472_012635 [Pythium oligandrum]|uniref:WRKY19-like zinc finger domain-containing protein n=1 Tax=Pythium oligandrum TaxID=41045 RepID=A0A8K1CE95_PYTOL|nr:hypothetical protein Poli38472_012635 [Pythium oligandrum]|eukprot:TMW61444.1 hypothetical protein Poli38472_012635 [Pythium oligandrum]